MSGLGNRLRSLWGYARLFQSPRDMYNYARLRLRYASGAGAGQPIPMRIRSLGGVPMLCRASRDVWTLRSTFLSGFHLPSNPLPENATILDLGSNIGYTVADLAHHFPSARVFGVEMDAGNLELARKNTARFGSRVHLMHAAVWTREGQIAYTGEHDDAFCVDDRALPGAAMTAPAKRIETILDEYGIEQVDYLKMDIEGAEAAIFAGPLEWTDRVSSMKVEIHPPATFDQCREALHARGFSCSRDEAHRDCLYAVKDQ